MTNVKQKGYRCEQRIVALHRAAGVAAERVPLSGSVGGSYAGDIVVNGDLVGEIKARKSGDGFRVIEKWLGDRDLLFVRKDRSDPTVVMPWSTYVHLLRAATGELDA